MTLRNHRGCGEQSLRVMRPRVQSSTDVRDIKLVEKTCTDDDTISTSHVGLAAQVGWNRRTVLRAIRLSH